MAQNIDSNLFDAISTTTCKITTMSSSSKQQEVVYETSKFIFNALIGSSNSTALIKRIKESKYNNYIIVVPTTIIVNNF